MTAPTGGDREAAPPSGERSAAYRLAEGLHLRQWLSRAAAPLAVLCTNGAGLLDVAWLPRHDAPLRALGISPAADHVTRGVAVVLIAAAVWLRIRSKGVLVRRTTLTTGGVYARVRHPFYLAVIIGSAGLLTLAGPLGAIVAAGWIAVAAPVYAATVAGEEDGLSTLYPDAWQAYAARVPRLLPVPGRHGPDATATRVTWANLVREHEPPRLLRYLAGVLAVAGCVAGEAPGVALLGLAAALLVASRALPRIRPESRRRGAG